MDENFESEIIDLDADDVSGGRNPFLRKNEKDHNALLAVATFIVDKRNLFFLLYIILIVFSAISRNWVKVENSLSAYLPDDSETSIGLELMESEFVTYGTASIMVTNIDEEQAANIQDLLENQSEVYMLSFDMEDDYKNFSALYSVTYMYSEDDPKAVRALHRTEDMLKDYDTYITTPLIDNSADNIAAEIRRIIVLVAIIVVAVLIITSQTYAEVPVLIMTFLSSAIIAMGTNFLLGTISFVSNSVTIVLQLALSVDYAIIFCNRYKEEHITRGLREAVIVALSKSIPEITASSLTTIGGLVAMMFMQFTLGRDLAICLIKAIFLSLCSVFLLMPGLLMIFGYAMDKTRHKSFVPKISLVGKFTYYTRFIVPPLFVVALVFAFIIQKNTSYVYGYTLLTTPLQNDDQKIEEAITETFGDTNMLALCIPGGDFVTQKELVDILSERDEIDSIISMTNTEAKGGYMLSDKLTPRQFCEVMDIDYNVAELLYTAHAAKGEDYGRIISGIDAYQVEFYDMINFLYDEARNGYVELDDETMANLEDAHVKIGIATNQLMGEEYDRMLMYLNLPVEGEETFAFLDEIHSICREFYDDEVYAVGDSTSQYDLCKTFSTDNTIVSFVSIIAVLAVLLFTFKSAGMPVLLIMVIQGAIWANFSFPALKHSYIFFLSYLIVTSIQMGANIDYAIVISSRFMDVKDKMSKKDAIVDTLNFAFPTIITSGTMLTMAGVLIGNMTSDAAIVGIGQCIGRGTIISIVIVMLILPQILLLGEKIIDRTKFTVSVPVVLKHSDDVVRVDGWFKGKMFSIAIAFLLTGSVLMGALAPARTAYAVGTGLNAGENAADDTEAREVLSISTADDFIKLCKDCRVDSYSKDLVVELTNDINLSDASLSMINAPLGYLCIPYWNGCFQANGHRLTGLSFTTSGYSDGLFRFVGEDGIIEDLEVQAVIRFPELGQDISGGIAGTNRGIISGCSFNGALSGKQRVGGIAGVNEETGIITDCSAHGTVSGFASVGGIAGENHGVIAGSTNRAILNNTAEWLLEEDQTDLMDLISNITATGMKNEDRSSGSADVGGVCGYSDGAITDSSNHGLIGYPYAGFNVGGICGRSIGRIYRCDNYALVQGRKDVGGICGQMEPELTVDNSETVNTAVNDLDSSINSTRRTVEKYIESWNYVEPAEGEFFGNIEHDDTDAFNESLKGNVNNVQAQTNRTIKVIDKAGDSIKDFHISDYYEDISDTVADEDTAARVDGCSNTGAIRATRNAGGIAGSMSMDEQDADEAEGLEDEKIVAGSVFQTKCVLVNSDSNCIVSVREGMAGSVCGYSGIGVIKNCKGYGRVKTDAGSFIGGICGESTAIIRNSTSAANLTGNEYVGGIAGLGRIVTGCISAPVVTGDADRVGGVLGQALAEDGTYKVTEENLGANIFMSVILEGIDSVSYETMAKKVSFVDLSDMPNVEADTEALENAIIFDEVEEEEAPVYRTVTSGDNVVTDENGDVHPIAMVSGHFKKYPTLSADTIMIDVSSIMEEGTAECYLISMHGGSMAGLPLRVWCDGDEKSEIYILSEGYFKELPVKIRGKYADLEALSDEVTICVIHPDYSRRNMTFIVMGVIATGIFAMVILILVKLVVGSKRGIERLIARKAKKAAKSEKRYKKEKEKALRAKAAMENNRKKAEKKKRRSENEAHTGGHKK